MPEGDTIFRTARALGRAFAGKPITGFRSTFPKLTRFREDTPLTGQLIDSVEARGKWLLIHFSGGSTLATHMLIHGSWHIYRHGERWQQPSFNMRIVLENRDYIAVGFRVPVAEMHTARSLARDRRIPSPAVDVLSPEFDAEEAGRRLLAYPHEAVGDVLLHQDVLAGVGNIFKSEICFVTRVHPFAKVAALTPEQVKSLVVTANKLVAANVLEDSDNSIVTYGRRRTTHRSEPGETLWVYGRNGEPCRRCGEPIRSRLQGPNARVTYWCATCQPMPDGSEVSG
jgi:endonuclease VIII